MTGFAVTCLLAASTCLIPAARRAIDRLIQDAPERVYIGVLAAFTFLASAGYLYHYLGGAPRIIDATSYWLQARTFAHGSFSFPAPGPIHSFAGRFLVATPNGELAVLFPPGFAALLAIGVRLGAPLFVNPLLGATSAVLTYLLARSWFDEKVARLAGVLSLLCATLRYHSADTMSHVWSACLVLTLLLAVTRSLRADRFGFENFLAGLAGGLLFATRPLTGLVFGGVGLVAAISRRGGSRARLTAFTCYGLGLLPGAALWFGYQEATTGSVWGSTQTLYYARSDWPENCFRLGLGATIGCHFEHGDFLERYQRDGFTAIEALRVSARRLLQNNRDVANFPGSLLLVLFSLYWVRKSRSIAAAWILIGTHVLAYSLFYFDGNYPGGGARLLVDVLPLEHVLAAVTLTRLHMTSGAWVLPLTGFACFGETEHQALSKREGGRPMFEVEQLERAGVERGIVFVATDHGFNLGFEPHSSPHATPLVVRRRNDAFDNAVLEHWGNPVSYRYDFDPFHSGASPRLTPWTPPPQPTFSGSSLWPPLESQGGGTTFTHYTPCGNGAALQLHPAQGAQWIDVEVWTREPGLHRIEWLGDGPMEVAEWGLSAETAEGACTRRVSVPRRVEAGPQRLRVYARRSTSLVELSIQPWSGP